MLDRQAITLLCPVNLGGGACMPTRETWKRFTVNENLMAEMKEKLFVPERNIDWLPKLNA
jgi:hypothetical protein